MPQPSTKPAWIEATCRALRGRTPLPDLTGVSPDDPAWLEVAIRTGVAEVDRIVDRISPVMAWAMLIQRFKQWGAGVGGLQDLALRAAEEPRSRVQESELRQAMLGKLVEPAGKPVMREALRWLDPTHDAEFPAFLNRCLHEAVRQEQFELYWPLFKDRYRPDEVTPNASLPLAAIQSGHTQEVLAHWDWVVAMTPPSALGIALFWALTREDPAMFEALERTGPWPLPPADQIVTWVQSADDWATFDQLGVRDPDGFVLRPALREELDAVLTPLHAYLPHTRALHRNRTLAQQTATPSRARPRA